MDVTFDVLHENKIIYSQFTLEWDFFLATRLPEYTKTNNETPTQIEVLGIVHRGKIHHTETCLWPTAADNTDNGSFNSRKLTLGQFNCR